VNVSTRRLVIEAARLFGTTERDILSPSRFHRHVRPRWAVAYVLHLRGVHYAEIGRRLGRDHTTILHCVRNMPRRLAGDERLAEATDTLINCALDIWPRRVAASPSQQQETTP
jgi:chromosomal replication initiation ATPase DnaA